MSVVSRHREVAWVAGHERVVLVRLADPGGLPLVLTGGATVIWEVLDSPMSVAELADAVAVAVGLAVEEVHRDVVAFVDQALAGGLLVSTGSTGPGSGVSTGSTTSEATGSTTTEAAESLTPPDADS